jgi:tetratricopeptide (TPR) repeat protein
MSYLYLNKGEEAVRYAERATMFGRTKDQAHAYYTLARAYSGGLGKHDDALRCMQRAMTLGLQRSIEEVVTSPHLKQLQEREEFKALTRFGHEFKYEEQLLLHDVHILNKSGFTWTNVGVSVVIDEQKPAVQFALALQPGEVLTIKDVSRKAFRDIRKIEVKIVCDQGSWQKDEK